MEILQHIKIKLTPFNPSRYEPPYTDCPDVYREESYLEASRVVLPMRSAEL
jgi:hypothetical protein